MQKPSNTFSDLLAHQKSYQERLNLVASENALCMNARLAFLTDAINRYYFPPERKGWGFPGNEALERIFTRCEGYLKKLTGASHVALQPVSGLNAMTVALAGLVRAGDTVATIAPENGGHPITTRLAWRLGLRVVHLPYDQEKFSVDVTALGKFVTDERVSLIYLDKTHILFPYPLRAMRDVVPREVPIYYDGSHVMGLIFGGQFQNPLAEGAQFLGGSTHKTIPGPHKGFIATNDSERFRAIDEYAARTFVSHNHPADVAALAVLFEEMEGKWEEYAVRVIANARAFARALHDYGFSVVGDPKREFTGSHQVWIDTEPYCNAEDAMKKLAECNVIVNATSAPSITGRMALRIGVQEITYLGAREEIMREIAEIFYKVLITRKASEDAIQSQVREIKKLLTQELSKEQFEEIVTLLGS